MVVRRVVAAVVLSVVSTFAGLSGDARAEETTGQCSLGHRYPIQSVTRYMTVENAGYTTYDQFRGAEVIVPAQPGLTREWLQRVLSYQVAAGECDFGTRAATVSVLPAGGAFSVRITGTDDRTAGEILRHAQQMTAK
jgi:hypothetical protein